MKSSRLAIPSAGIKGMRDVVSPIFAKAPVFTIVEFSDGEIRKVWKESNPASNLKQGSGPVSAKYLKDLGVNAVVAGEIGPGARKLMEFSGIRMIQVDPGTKVSDAVAIALQELYCEKP